MPNTEPPFTILLTGQCNQATACPDCNSAFEQGQLSVSTILSRPNALAMSTNPVLPCLSQAELHGVIPARQGSFEGLQQTALRWGNRLRQAAAVCNSLTMISKATVVGEDMERLLFKNVEARFVVSCAPFMPDVLH